MNKSGYYGIMPGLHPEVSRKGFLSYSRYLFAINDLISRECSNLSAINVYFDLSGYFGSDISTLNWII